MPTTEVGLHETLAGDIYVAIGDTSADGARVIRLYFNPFVTMIWLGGVIMFVGGLLSLTDRRYRVGAPRPAGAASGSASRMNLQTLITFFLLIVSLSGAALAVQPDEMLKDPRA